MKGLKILYPSSLGLIVNKKIYEILNKSDLNLFYSVRTHINI